MRYDRISIHYALNIYWTFRYNRQKDGVRYARNGKYVPYQSQLFSEKKHYRKSMNITGYHTQFDDYGEVDQKILHDIERIKSGTDIALAYKKNSSYS